MAKQGDPVLEADSFDTEVADGGGRHGKDGAAAASPGALQRDLMAGLEMGLAAIEAFDQERPRLSITEVAERSGLTRAAARRYLMTLRHRGYVQEDGKLFGLAPKVLRLGRSCMHSARLPRVMQPQLQKLACALHEGSAVGVLDHDEVIAIAAASAGRVVSAPLQPGTRVPAFCTRHGRTLVAAMTDDRRDAWLARRTLTSLTSPTITSPERLELELLRTRAQGYAMVDQELEIELRTMAVPLRNGRGDVVAALNASALASRMRMDQLVEQRPAPLLHAQEQLRTLL